jgi:predicted nucleic acid-binding Zn ribbon protein
MEWRGLPEIPFTKDTAKPISESLGKLMSSLGLGERLRENEVRRAWKDVVGDFLATHSEPQALRNGVLIVRVLQSTVYFELERMWKREILAKLKQRFGARTVRDIKFRIG